MQEIPLIAAVNQELLVILPDDQDCTLALYQRGDGFYLDLSVGTTEVCRGAVCMSGIGIVQHAQSVFSGQLYFADMRTTPQQQKPPQWEGLGTRWRLYYMTAVELEEMRKARRREVFDA